MGQRHKPFYCLTQRKEGDVRKREVIDMLGVGDRIITSHEEVEKITEWRLDYSTRITNKKLEELRIEGLDYLRKAIDD